MITWDKIIVLIIAVFTICGAIMTCDIIIIKEIREFKNVMKEFVDIIKKKKV